MQSNWGAPVTELAATQLYHSEVMSEGCWMSEHGSRRICLLFPFQQPPAADCFQSNGEGFACMMTVARIQS
jgi:hypothetical protein